MATPSSASHAPRRTNPGRLTHSSQNQPKASHVPYRTSPGPHRLLTEPQASHASHRISGLKCSSQKPRPHIPRRTQSLTHSSQKTRPDIFEVRTVLHSWPSCVELAKKLLNYGLWLLFSFCWPHLAVLGEEIVQGQALSPVVLTREECAPLAQTQPTKLKFLLPATVRIYILGSTCHYLFQL